jgi:hypothetical protein
MGLGTPRYRKGRDPISKPNLLAMIFNLTEEMEPAKIVDLEGLTHCPEFKAYL